MTSLTVVTGSAGLDENTSPHSAGGAGPSAPGRSSHAEAGDSSAVVLHVVPDGPRTADVLRFHSPRRERSGMPGPGVRTSGNTALAPEQAERQRPPARALRAVASPDEAGEVRHLAASITRAIMEVLAGVRPLQQLVPWLHRDLLAPIELRSALSRPRPAPGPRQGRGRDTARTSPPKLALAHRAVSVRSVHAARVAPGIYEVAVVVVDALRCRAVALRLESADRAGWQVTALEIG